MGTSAKAPVFVRDATGLVRALTAFDTFAFGVVGITPGVSLVLYYVYIVFLYPGVNMTLASIGAIPISLVFGAVYYLLAISMPRSGGDYVYGSRIVHPLWGLLPNWTYTYVNIFGGIGYYSATLGGSFLAPFLVMLGSFYNSPTLLNWAAVFSTSNAGFVVAVIAIWVSAAINVLGMRAFAKAQAVMFVIAMAGIVVLLILLGINNNQTFQVAFNQYAAAYNTSYTGIIQQAKNAGWTPQSYDLTQTLFALPYLAGVSLATVWPVLAGGEIRNPKKSLLWGTLGAILISGVIFVLGAVLFYNTVGDQFAKAYSYISNSGTTTNPLPVGPYIQYLTSMLTNNPVIIFFLGFSFFIWGLILLPAFYVIVTRSIFAWSFDRILPSFLADISDTYHAPLKCILIIAILGTVGAAMTIYTSLFGLYFNITLAVSSCFIFAGVAAAVFPFSKRAKSIYEQAPSIVKIKLAGIPVISVLGVLEAIMFLYLTYLDIVSPALSGPVTPTSVGLVAGVYISAIVVYYVAKVYRKGHGMDLEMAFQEIPPE
jgi:amino acid transporter